MSEAANCNNLLNAAIAVANCLGHKNPGGVDGRVYFGFRSDLASVTIDGTSKELTAITLASGKKLYKYASLKNLHEFSVAVKVQKPKNMYTQNASLFLYPYTQLEAEAIEKLIDAEGLFCFVTLSNGRIKAYGIDTNPWIPSELYGERGLKCSAGSMTEGKTVDADNWTNVVLTGDFWNGPKLFLTSATLASNIATLDALCV